MKIYIVCSSGSIKVESTYMYLYIIASNGNRSMDNRVCLWINNSYRQVAPMTRRFSIRISKYKGNCEKLMNSPKLHRSPTARYRCRVWKFYPSNINFIPKSVFTCKCSGRATQEKIKANTIFTWHYTYLVYVPSPLTEEMQSWNLNSTNVVNGMISGATAKI